MTAILGPLMTDATTPDDRIYLDTEQASEALQSLGIRLSASTLRKLRVSGMGPGFTKARRSVYYPLSELKAWVEEQRSPVVRSTSELSAKQHSKVIALRKG